MYSSIKKFGRIILSFRGFSYDWIRYIKYNSWYMNMSDSKVRSYHITKNAHALEKSMSYENRRDEAGYNNALNLLYLLIDAQDGEITFQDKIAAKTLQNFCLLDRKEFQTEFLEIYKKIPQLPDVNSECGVKELSQKDMQQGAIDDPEAFFNSRYTLREFKRKVVSDELVYRSLRLAQKTPSSCNMQPWHVYHVKSKKNIQKALEIQKGNRGFGDKIDNLLIITSDQTSFITSFERYQHWIDGGLYSMSLIYAMHSIGLATCCLNWSEDPKRDKLLRKELNIKGEHSIIMMIAFGYPKEVNKVCVSPRKSLEKIITTI